MTEEDVKEAFLEHAVKNGIVTYEELYEAFPPGYVDMDNFCDFLALLEDLGVRVVDTGEHLNPKIRRKRAA